MAGLLVACFLLLLAGARADESALEELQGLSLGARDRIIRLRDDSYKKFARSPGVKRQYSIVVFFDAEMLRDNHQLNLPQFRKEYAQVVKAYFEGVEGKAGVQPVFFADIEFKQSENTFRAESINSLPHVKFFGAGDETKAVQLDFNRFGKNFAGIVDFLKDNGVDTSDLKPPPPMSQSQMIFLGASVIVLAPIFASYVLTRKTIFHDPRLWCLGGLSIYLFSVSGGMFNIIRNMPWYVPSREKPGEYVYFLKQSGNQFGVEGLTIGAFYTTVGLVMAFNIYVLPQSKNTTLKRVLGMISLLACAFAVRKVVEMEVWKQGYWVHGFWPSSWR